MVIVMVSECEVHGYIFIAYLDPFRDNSCGPSELASHAAEARVHIREHLYLVQVHWCKTRIFSWLLSNILLSLFS